MSVLQNLEIGFGKETSPTELTNTEVTTLVTAIGTKRTSSSYSITLTLAGVTLLSGYIKPANNGSITESNKYIIEKNGVTVLGNVETETYTLSVPTGTFEEGTTLLVSCANASSTVSMLSMTTWVFIDFGNLVKSTILPDEVIRSQFNVTWDSSPLSDELYNLIFPNSTNTNTTYRGILNDSNGLLKFTTSEYNYSWSGQIIIRAYPSSIDNDETTTETTRVLRLTSAITKDVESIAVTGGNIACNRSSLTPGDIVKFSIDGLLPTNNTKSSLINYTDSSVSYTLTADLGTIENNQYQVPDVGSFTITCSLNYMGMILTNTKTYTMSTCVMSKTKNYPSYKCVCQVMKYTADELKASDLSPINSTLMTSIMALFNENGVTDFSWLAYCSKVITLSLTTDYPNITTIGSSYITSITGTGTLKGVQSIDSTDFPNVVLINNPVLFKGNTVLTQANFPKCATIRCTTATNEIFSGCISLDSVNFPALTTIICGQDNYMFNNCASLTTIDFSTVSSYTVAGADYICYNCGSLRTFKMPLITSFENRTKAIAMFAECNQLSEFDMKLKALSITSGTDGIYMFLNCVALETIDTSELVTVSCLGPNYMFNGCSSIGEFDFNVETIKCSDNYMFSGCSSLFSMDLSSITSYTITGTDAMLYDCSMLNSITMPMEVLSSSNNKMLENCPLLKSVDCPNLTTITTGELTMFKDCITLSGITLPKLLTITCTLNLMFSNCSLLNYSSSYPIIPSLVTLSELNDEMFNNCSNLTALTYQQLKTITCSENYAPFTGCIILTSVGYPSLTTLNVTGSLQFSLSETLSITSVAFPLLATISSGDNNIFKDLSILTLSLPELTTITSTGNNYMLNNCSILTTLSIPKLTKVTCTEILKPFDGCSSLTGTDFSSIQEISQTSTSSGSNNFFKGIKDTTITLTNLLKLKGYVINLFESTIEQVYMPAIQLISSLTDLEVFSGCSALSIVSLGKYSEDSNGLIIGEEVDASNFFKDVPSSTIVTEISAGTDNMITSRITSLLCSNFLSSYTFGDITFPHLDSGTPEGLLNMSANRIIIG